jgi:hyperosmotically inducible protein
MKAITTKLLALFTVLLIGGATVFGNPVPGDTNGTANQPSPEKIRKELVTLPYYGVFDNLAYQINGSTVTLYGQVTRPTTRSDAARRISRVAGVSNVVNRIEVLPLSNFDDSIRVRTYRTLFNAGGLYRYAMGANPSIHIVVKNGNVTLEGVVNNVGDARLAYITARTVPGVFSVTNHLRVEGNNKESR